MAEEKQRVSLPALRNLVPVSQLTQDNLRDLADKTFLETLPAGRLLFKVGDVDNNSYYLLAGEVVLSSPGAPDKTIAAGTPAARYPLDHHRPRQATATARTDIQFVRIDNDFLDILLTWDQNAGYMVTEIEVEEAGSDDNDWMTNILRSSLFHRIPPSNIQKMFMRMEAVPVKAGDVVIRQGGEGDYYYYISKGRCLVTRDSAKGDKVIKLAELEAGASFGEEALISGARRNANVTMLSDGMLMRLAKADFEALLKAPVLSTVGYEQAQEMVDGGAIWLDVRLENEHKNYAIPGSLHIPLYLLRIKAPALEKNKKYIVYCDTGRRSSSAAYLLSERGFEAHVLRGGLMSVRQEHQPA